MYSNKFIRGNEIITAYLDGVKNQLLKAQAFKI